MPFRRAQLGASRKPLSLRDRNALADTVHAVENAQPPSAPATAPQFRVANLTGQTVFAGGVLGLPAPTDPICSDTVPEWRFLQVNAARGAKPLIPDHLTRWCVLTEDALPNRIVRATIAGEAWARVIVRDPAHECIQPRHNDPTYAVTCPSSIARILWLEPERSSPARQPYPWRWARVAMQPSSLFEIEAYLTQDLQAAAVTYVSADDDINGAIAADDLETFTAASGTPFAGNAYDTPEGVFVTIEHAGPDDTDLTVRLYRINDTTARIDPPAYQAVPAAVLKSLTRKLLSTHATAQIREQRGNGWVRTPHQLTVENVDHSVATLPVGTLVGLVPWTLGRWRMVWASCSALPTAAYSMTFER